MLKFNSSKAPEDRFQRYQTATDTLNNYRRYGEAEAYLRLRLAAPNAA